MMSNYHALLLYVLIGTACMGQLSPAAVAQSVDYDLPVGAPGAWVVEPELETLPKREGMVRTRYHLISNQLHKDENGVVENYTRIRSEPLTATGLEDVSTIELFYQPDFQNLVLHHITVERGGQVFDKTDSMIVQQFRDEGSAGTGIYSGGSQLDLILADVRVGDIIDVAYTVEGVNPIFGDRFFSMNQFGWETPVDRALLRYSLPKNEDLSVEVYNSDARATRDEEDGMQIVELSLQELPGLEVSSETPGSYYPYPFIAVSGYESWRKPRHMAAMPTTTDPSSPTIP